MGKRGTEDRILCVEIRNEKMGCLRRVKENKIKGTAAKESLTGSSPSQAVRYNSIYRIFLCFRGCARMILAGSKTGVETEAQRGDMTCLRSHTS